jgi:hypothetical protein
MAVEVFYAFTSPNHLKTVAVNHDLGWSRATVVVATLDHGIGAGRVNRE